MKVQKNLVEVRGGADLAERFNVSGDKVEPGTLMVIDANNPGHLTISRSAYDTKVAGIVSGAGDVKPGLTLQQEGVLDGDTQVAIAGRVNDGQTGKPVGSAQVSITNMPDAFKKKLEGASKQYGTRWDSLADRPDRTRRTARS